MSARTVRRGSCLAAIIVAAVASVPALRAQKSTFTSTAASP
ncbi:MAG TPA: hypothetical protein VLI43_00940 [Gemmatimonadaceae bacterium]|nr:hypothetical protein [Gemmatimonadaceae bacterium]